MSNPILSIWEHKSATQTTEKIIPDGCRDLLFWACPGQRPSWSITSLDNHPYNTKIQTGAYLKGFRLQPGTLINPHELLKSVQSLEGKVLEVTERVNSFCQISPNVSEAMSCLGAPETKSIKYAAKTLGVTMRTLQRLLKGQTERSPAGWLSLSRARRAARISSGSSSLAKIAYELGYSDQSHMSRELQRWFGTSPAKIPLDKAIMQQLNQPGYY